MDKNGIKAYMRAVPGSSIKEIRAVTCIDAKLEEIAEVVLDVPANVEWLPYCSVSELLTRHGRFALDAYIVMDMPFPVSDRDGIVSGTGALYSDLGRAIADFRGIADPRKPLYDDKVRMPDFSGFFVFEYISRNRTGVIYTYRVDMGGNIPAWLINFLGKYTLYDTFRNLQRQVVKPKYMEAAKNSPNRAMVESILENPEKVRLIFRNRLGEFIKDQGFIEAMADDQKMVDRFFDSTDALAEVLLYGWGSEKSRKTAIRELLAAHISVRATDHEKVRQIVEDDQLVDAILLGGQNAMEMIGRRIEN